MVPTAPPSAPPPQALSYSWLRSVARELFALDEAPLLGAPPPFPWEGLSKALSNSLGVPIQLTPGELRWREAKELLQGIAAPHLTAYLATAAVDGELSFWMSEGDLQRLMAATLHLEPAQLLNQPQEYTTSFFRFITMQTLYLFQGLSTDKRLALKLATPPTEVPEAALCQDVQMTVGTTHMVARLVISNAFRRSYAAYSLQGAQRPTPAQLEALSLTVHLEVGRATLRLHTWMKAQAGDFVPLDQVFYDLEKQPLVLTLSGVPLFQASLEANGSLKLSAIPPQHEVYMAPEPPPSPSPQEIAASLENDPFASEDEEEADLEPAHEADEEELDLHEAVPVAKTAPPPPKPAAPPPQPHPAPASHPATVVPGKRPTLDDIPLTITVELAQLQLSAQKVLALQPGNMLDTHLKADHPVQLLANGRCIARGELIKIGDTLGVRLLEVV